MNVALVDIAKPGAKFGWAMVGDTTGEGNDIDVCFKSLAEALRNGPLTLGFEAPVFVPIRTDPKRLTAKKLCHKLFGTPSKAEAKQRLATDCAFVAELAI